MNAALLERKRRLASDPKNRLKWRILWEFGVLPVENKAELLDDDSLVDCALNLILDRERHPAPVDNPNFDMDKFLAQREEQRHGIK